MTEKDADDTIHLKVKSQENDEVFFKIKRSTQLGKLMQKYCERQGVDSVQQDLQSSERALSLRRREDPREEHAERCSFGLPQLNMQSGDEIDVVIEQVGGKKDSMPPQCQT